MSVLRALSLVTALAASAPLPAGEAGLDTAAASRLPAGVRPTAQRIELRLDSRRAAYSGRTWIDVQVDGLTDALVLHAGGPRITAAMLRGGGAARPATVEPGPWETVRLRPEAAIEPGAWTVELSFDAPFDEQATGLYRLRDGDAWYAFTQFQADDARQAFPCFDEPSMKVPWDVVLEVPAGTEAISNMPVASSTEEGGWRRVVFDRSPPLPSYLVAFAVGPFDTVPIPGLSIPGRVVTVKGAASMAGEAARITPPVLRELERWFGRPYPFAKLDLIAVPEFWPGAMENPGAITFADDVLLVAPGAVDPEQRRNLVATTAHELAHMWFGDLVTMAWWDDLWLNEAFASWLGDKAALVAFPDLELDVHAVQAMQGAMATDARASTRAIRQPVGAADNLFQMADELAYDKGQAVLTMTEAWLGPEVFRRGVLRHVAAHEWGNASAADLWQALDAEAGDDVAAIVRGFVDQAGVPLVVIEPLGAGRVRLSQRRFARLGVEAPATSWRVPVRLRYARDGHVHDHAVLLAQTAQVVELPGHGDIDWIHGNAGERGYYRWQAPSSMLVALAAPGAAPLDRRERVGLVGNVSALAAAGLVSGGDWLGAVESFAADPDPLVVASALSALGTIEDAFVTDELRPSFAAWIRRTLSPALERFGHEARGDEPRATTELRGDLLSWLGEAGEAPGVRERARELARAYANRPDSVDPVLARFALRLTAMDGDEKLFDEYRRRFETADSPAERDRWLTALGRFRRPALVDDALRYALSGPLRPQELTAIPFGVRSSPALADHVFDWATQNYGAIAARIPEPYLVYLPYLAGGCSVERLERAEVFFGRHPVPGLDLELRKVAESVHECADLRRREGPAVAAWLEEAATRSASPAPEDARVLLETELGDIDIEVLGSAAPITAANFLRYVDLGRYDGGVFHRTVRPGNQPGQDVKIEVVQASVAPEHQHEDFEPIPLERTSVTGLRHVDGTVSMARAEPDTATSDFFICIGDQTELDHGGRRNPDGQGFAAFGRVVRGMDVVERIQASAADGQKLTPPVRIRHARRIRGR